jgi:flagellar FliL protein
MSDSDDLNLDEVDSSGGDTKKKTSGLAALLPNLLKFVAIGLGAVIFIVTVCFITYSILNKGGQSQTNIPSNSPFAAPRPQYSVFTSIGIIRTTTRDPIPYSVIVDMVIHYDQTDNTASGEFTGRLYELRDFVRSFFRAKSADELRPENEPRLKQEIIEQLNTKVLSSTRARMITFNQLDVMAMQ